ncbi:unnamed protein product [Diplocarpon coronariae]|uniref:Hydrolase n=1 Tax=Diplocarpon coronariae TaxID=2795749 RepID=A0A218ZJJ5_9HELO|nr:hydrolase [Marssonina coronariae]
MYILARTLIPVLGALSSLSAAFQNPIRNPGPDPSMVYVDGQYFLTYTSWDSITITRSKTLAGLTKGETKTIWTDSNPKRSADMWAPEIHQIDSTWYMFYSSCDSTVACCGSCITRVLKGCSGPNPYDCKYSYLAELLPPVGKRGGPNKDIAFSIDGTYLNIPGKGRYHVLSMSDENNIQSIAITELNTTTWTVSGWNVISVPEQPWERHGVPVNEAPHPLYYNGEIWLSYSGSYCWTPDYALGLLKYNGGDPLLKSSWVKTGPVFSKANGNYGTGHNAFFSSPDGKEIWNVFHATSNEKGSCGRDRYTMTQPITFESGKPKFGTPQQLSEVLVVPSGE